MFIKRLYAVRSSKSVKGKPKTYSLYSEDDEVLGINQVLAMSAIQLLQSAYWEGTAVVPVTLQLIPLLKVYPVSVRRKAKVWLARADPTAEPFGLEFLSFDERFRPLYTPSRFNKPGIRLPNFNWRCVRLSQRDIPLEYEHCYPLVPVVHFDPVDFENSF